MRKLIEIEHRNSLELAVLLVVFFHGKRFIISKTNTYRLCPVHKALWIDLVLGVISSANGPSLEVFLKHVHIFKYCNGHSFIL